MLLSFTDTLMEFYAAFVVIAFGTSMCGFFPVNVALIHWFERWRARALSSMSLGLALGGISVPLVAWSLQTYGWRATAFGSGVIAIALGLPLAFFIRRRPEDYGLRMDGVSEKDSPHQDQQANNPENQETRDFTAREALRTPAFWLLSLGHGFALLVVHAVTVHSITHMSQGLGYTVAQASLVYTLLTLSQIGGVDWLAHRRSLRQAPARRRVHGRPHGWAPAPYLRRFPSRLVPGGSRLRRPARRRLGAARPFMQALRADTSAAARSA